MAAVLGRYARAFAEVVVRQRDGIEKTVAELEQVSVLMESSRELRNVLQNPAVDHEQKLKLLDAIISRMDASKLLRNFLAVLIDHRRIGSIGEIVPLFKQELDRRMGIAEARVSSVRALTPEERKALQAQLSAMTGQTVRATYSEDPSLLGGVVVRMGSTIYDGSVQGKLQKIRQQMTNS
ncbi:MAG TPA: ATP synthase F1 subunit delta [Candidatus Angelobacter sp.]|nr:ATP synthase F1 subunit delta [Candidatus Angelobacter sp.]